MLNKLLSLQDACKYVGRTEETLRKAIKNKEIPCKFFRGGYLFSRLALELWASGLDLNGIKEVINCNIINEFKEENTLIERLVG